MGTVEEFVASVRADLREAQRRRDRLAVSALREILSIIDNASAVEAPQRYDYSGTEPTEVPRREVSLHDVRALLLVHVEEQHQAVTTYRELEMVDHAEALEEQTRIVLRYLDDRS